MEKILKSYLKKLTNLTGSNKSLLQLRLQVSQDLDLHGADFLDGKSSYDIIHNLIAGRKSIVCDILDSRNSYVNETSKRLRRIQRRDKFILEERGARDLYIGWPYVKGKMYDGTPIRCPLLFFPVDLVEKSNKWQISPRADVAVTFNKSFLLAYAHFNEIDLSDDFIEQELTDFSKETTSFKNELYNYLKGSPIEINFNQELFEEQLIDYKDYKKADFDHHFKTGQIKLFQEAVIGIFPQAGSYLVPDYSQLLNAPPAPDLESFFVSKSSTITATKIDPLGLRFISDVREEETFTPYKIDASQENAIKAVKKGNSIVVQGPPGTGKSQLICNLISDFISRGKSVLVVCQKRAALDVVHSRLGEKQLSDFAALVHDFKSDRKAIYEQISSQIDRIEEYRQKNNSLDSIYLERNYLQASRKIDQITEQLEEFKAALFDLSECGLSPKELYLTSDPKAEALNLKMEYRHFDLTKINQLTDQLKKYLPYYKKIESPSFAWHDRVSFHDFDMSDLRTIKELLQEIPAYGNHFEEEIKAILGDPFSVQESEWIHDRRNEITDLLKILKTKRVFKYFKHLLKFTSDKDWLVLEEQRIFELFQDHGMETSLANSELSEFLGQLENCIQARKRLPKWIWYSIFNKDKYRIKKVMVANNLAWSKRAFRVLSQKIDNRLNLEHHLTLLREKEWLLEIPETHDRAKLQKWFDNMYMSLEAKSYSEELRSFRDYWRLDTSDYDELSRNLRRILELCEDAQLQQTKWHRHFTPSQIGRVLNEETAVRTLSNAVEHEFDSICEYDKLKRGFLEVEKTVVDRLLDNVEEVEEDKVISLFQNSIRLCWIDHFENKYPILRSVSSLKMKQMERELQDGIVEKTQASGDIVLLKARERIYEGVEYNRLRNMVTYRDLKHQTTKKRKIWPLRKTIEQFEEEIFKLIPCWMASPESVSAVFPLASKFDLVIFDEASQCFAEKGLPALTRGRQVVIAGDSQQLRPNDLYQVRWDDEDEDPDLEIDSLLDLGSKYLLQVFLRGHYRSRSIDLIDFSNKNFYNGKLRLLPDYDQIDNEEANIHFKKVDGLWQEGCNQMEASAVCRLALELIEKGEFSIGIVTFNFKQQQIVQEELFQLSLAQKVILPDSVFVKNIENVQGDERNVIIFSIGYAPDAKGKMNMHFGSLNAEGGENRLNVAVTRAKDKIYVVSSILPQQLSTDNALHPGPGLFKEYLDYAYRVSNNEYEFDYPESGKHPPSWYLSTHLQKSGKGYEMKRDLPFADLSIVKGKKHHKLVLTDDNVYHEAPSVKDSHAYTPLNLRSKKWKFDRVFSRNYWQDPKETEKELVKELHQSEADTSSDN